MKKTKSKSAMPRGMHRMPGGMMMSDKEMKKMRAKNMGKKMKY